MAAPYASTVAPGPYTGILGSQNLQTDLAKKSFAGMITRLMPNGSATLFGLTALLGDETALAYEHGYFAKVMIFPYFNLNANPTTFTSGTTITQFAEETWNTISTNASTSVAVTSVIAGMVMMGVTISTGVPTGEVILIREVLGANSVRVLRNVGGLPGGSGPGFIGAGLSTGVVWYQIGTAYSKASNRPNALGIIPVRIVNFTQIFRNTWTVSGTVQATQVIAGTSNVAENRMDNAAFHAADIEKAIFFGQRQTSAPSTNNQPLRTMDGIVPIVSNPANYPAAFPTVNVYTAASTQTATTLENMLDPCFNQNTDPKIANSRLLFVGGSAKRVINRICRVNGEYQLEDRQTSWGLQFSTYRSARGNFEIIEHPLFNSNPAWAAMAVAVDPSSIRLAYLGGRKTQSREFNMDNVTVDNGIDAVGGTLTTECTLMVKNPPANAVIYGLGNVTTVNVG
jgi:hypothetical protein